MSRFEPIPWDDLPAEARAIIEEGESTGMYTQRVPLQVMAYASAAMRSMHDAYRATFGRGLLEPRLAELLRLRSAQAGGCALCERSRKEASVTESQVSCLLEPDPAHFSERELTALRFFDLLAYDHTTIDDLTYRELGEHFTPAEIIELGYLCGNMVGVHRFMHTLDLAGDGEPLFTYAPDEIDRRTP